MREKNEYPIVCMGTFVHVTPPDDDPWFDALPAPRPFSITDIFFYILLFLPFHDIERLTSVNRKMLGLRSKTPDHSLGEEILARTCQENLIAFLKRPQFINCLETEIYPNQEQYFEERKKLYHRLLGSSHARVINGGNEIEFLTPEKNIVFCAFTGNLSPAPENQSKDFPPNNLPRYSLWDEESDEEMRYSDYEDYFIIRNKSTKNMIHQSRMGGAAICGITRHGNWVFFIECDKDNRLRLQKYAIPTDMLRPPRSNSAFFKERKEFAELPEEEIKISRKRPRE